MKMLDNSFGIRKHDFQAAKAKIKIFSEKELNELTFENVATDKYFGLINHTVTGGELNERIDKIQSHFIQINSQLNQIKGQFGCVYETFESLDKDYIEGMLASIGAANKASDQARIAAERAYETSEEAKKNSYDINRLLQNQIAIIDKLQQTNESFVSQFATTQNEIDQIKAIANERFEILGKLISSQSNSLAEIKSRQIKKNEDFVFKIEKLRDEARENEQKLTDIFHLQNAVFSKKIKKAYILIGFLGLAAMANTLLAMLGVI